ncbi:hypothetical protein N9901_00970 [Flavobacteriaceae bacterium]|nr:hypothetical protein [Flavobacteriaceae bacterium]
MKQLIFLCILPLFVWSQNQHEPQNWKKIKTTNASVIFERGQEKNANSIINTIEYLHKNNHKSIYQNNTAINIILRSKSVESNGYVGLTPFRSEFYNSPPTSFYSLGTTNWLHTLAIHEYRHVQQYTNQKKGLSKTLYWLMGEPGWAIGNSLSIPNWYAEGDAVVIETALTNNGRGRLPSFTALQRAIAKENKKYSYATVRNGSLKYMTPNHYPLGYQLLNYYRNNYPQQELANISRNAAGFKKIFYPFSKELKSVSGLTTIDLFEKSNLENQEIWQSYRDSLKTVEYKIIADVNVVANYSNPRITNENDIVVIKTTLDKISAFYKIDNTGREKYLAPHAVTLDNYFDYANKTLLYTVVSQNPRYNFSSYNDVFLYNTETKKSTQLTHKKKYFRPRFINNTKQIIVLENTNIEENKLLILDTDTGNLNKEFLFKSVISSPIEINKNEIAFIKQLNHKVAIFKINTSSKTQTQLCNWTSHSIDDLHVNKELVYFSASFNGIDNIYAVNTNGNKNIIQYTNAAIGVYHPLINNEKIYFVNQTANGQKLSYTDLKPLKIINIVEPVEMEWNNSKTVGFEGGSILNKIDSINYKSKDYNASLQDFKIHSWNLSLNDQNFEVNVLGTNINNNLSIAGRYINYTNEINSQAFAINTSFKQWYPTIGVNFEHENREFNGVLKLPSTKINGVFNFNEYSLSTNIGVPLNQIHRNYSLSIQPSIGIEYHKRYNVSFIDNSETVYNINTLNKDFSLFNTSFNYNVIRRKATQHINTRAGFSTINTFNTSLNNSIDGNYIYTSNTLYLPGLVNSHNSILRFDYQKNELQKADSFAYARGYQPSIATEANKLSYTYQLPLTYPDFGLWGITYFKRIRANIFTDYSNLTYANGLKTKQHSVGFEILFDNTFFNINEANIGLGYRGSYLLQDDISRPNQSYFGKFFISTTLF